MGNREFYSPFMLFPVYRGFILSWQLWYHHNKLSTSGLVIVIPIQRAEINSKLVFQDTTTLPAERRKFSFVPDSWGTECISNMQSRLLTWETHGKAMNQIRHRPVFKRKIICPACSYAIVKLLKKL